MRVDSELLTGAPTETLLMALGADLLVPAEEAGSQLFAALRFSQNTLASRGTACVLLH